MVPLYNAYHNSPFSWICLGNSLGEFTKKKKNNDNTLHLRNNLLTLPSSPHIDLTNSRVYCTNSFNPHLIGASKLVSHGFTSKGLSTSLKDTEIKTSWHRNGTYGTPPVRFGVRGRVHIRKGLLKWTIIIHQPNIHSRELTYSMFGRRISSWNLLFESLMLCSSQKS